MYNTRSRTTKVLMEKEFTGVRRDRDMGNSNSSCGLVPNCGQKGSTVKERKDQDGSGEPDPINEQPKQTTPSSRPAEKPHAEGTSLGFCRCSKQDSKEGKGRTDSDVPLLSSYQSDTEGPHDDTSVSYGIQQTLVPRDTEAPPTSLPTHLSGDVSTLSGWSNEQPDGQNIPQQPKVESRQSPVPTPRNLHSMCSVENARYSVAEVPHPDHANDDRHFYLCDRGNRFRAFGVFDGHDGSNASEFASSYMEDFLQTNFLKAVETQEVKHTFGEKFERVLSEMFIKTDHAFFYRIRRVLDEKKKIRKKLQGHTSYEAYMLFPSHVARLQEIEPKISGGTTAVVAVLMDDWLYVANAGDSRAVLVQELDDNKSQLFTTQLSTDHTVDNEVELWRLEALGLDPEELKKTGRLGSQENTRCIGDYLIKDGYTEVDTISHAIEPPGISVPNIMGMKVSANSRYLLLMTDGVYKSLESMQDPSSSKTYDPMQDLVKRIQEAEKKSPKTFQEISKLTLSRIEENHHKTYQEHAQSDVQSPLAVQCRKRDDMTLIVYRFKFKEGGSQETGQFEEAENALQEQEEEGIRTKEELQDLAGTGRV